MMIIEGVKFLNNSKENAFKKALKWMPGSHGSSPIQELRAPVQSNVTSFDLIGSHIRRAYYGVGFIRERLPSTYDPA